MYTSYILEVSDLNEFLSEMDNEKVIAVTYASDSQQVLLITEKKEEEKPKFNFFSEKMEEEIEP